MESALSPPSACKWEEPQWLKAKSVHSLAAFVAIKLELSFRLSFESQILLADKQTAMVGRGFEASEQPPLRATIFGGVCGSTGESTPSDTVNKVQRKRNWNIRTSRSANLQNQRIMFSHIKSEKFEEQVFDKTLVRDLIPKRDLLSILAHNEDAEKFSGTKQDSQGSLGNEPEHSLEDAQARKSRDASPLGNMNTEGISVCSSVQELTEFALPTPSDGYDGNKLVRNQTRSRKQKTEDSAPYQIMIVLLSGKTLLQWVKPSDLVQSLKQKLEAKEGIPIALQRLLLEGKQLEDSNPLSCYNVQRNTSITHSLRLRGGAAGQSSSAATFSYKDVVHAHKSKNKIPPAQVPKPFLVDKLEEVSSIEINDPSLDLNHQVFAETGIICRFNGLWPRTADLYQWIHSNWTKNCKVHLCSKGFFIILFGKNEDYHRVLTEGPWFWNSAGLFLTPWFQDFDPSTAVITKLPIWVRLHNLPAHLWHYAVFEGIGNSLGRFLNADYSRVEQGIYTYARIYVEIDISRGLPDQINLKIGDFHWTQSLDFENTAFPCRNCHLTGHLQNSCPSILSHKKKADSKQKPKRWMPHDPPPLDVSSSSDEEDEKSDEEILADRLEQGTPDPVSTSVCLTETSVPPISQKRSHEASPSDSDKELSPSAQRSLQIIQNQQSTGLWIKVGKKQGKKGRPNDSTLAV